MKPYTEHCGFRVENVDYEEKSVTFVKNDTSEEVKFSFEFIQDLSKYTTGEWNWNEMHPKKSVKESIEEFITGEELTKLRNFQYGLGEDGLSVGTEYD